MKLTNARNHFEVSGNAKLVVTFFDSLFGLINPHNPRCLVLNTRFGIHTFFLQTPIDVIILDRRNRVVARRENLSSFRFFFYNPIFKKVVELPPGTIKTADIRMDDKILFT